MMHMPSTSCEVYFISNASAWELLLHSIFQIKSFSHRVLKPPLSFMFLFPLSPVFPLPDFSSVYTSAVIYLLFCGSNVVNMCLASLHTALICSQLKKSLEDHSKPTMPLIVHNTVDTSQRGGFLQHITLVHPLLIVSHF